MIKRLKHIFKEIEGYCRLHIDLNTIVIILLIILIFHRAFLGFVFSSVSFIETKFTIPEWIPGFLIGTLSNFISALILIPIIFWVFRISYKSKLCGKFKAFDIINGKEEFWGNLKLTYNIFSNRIRGRMRSDKHDADIIIDAIFERGEYLRGYYIEQKKVNRRRMGAFLLILDGSGDSYSGSYVFVDPKSNNIIPQEGKVKWVRK